MKKAQLKSIRFTVLPSMLLMLALFVTTQAHAMQSPDVVVKNTVDNLVGNIQKNRATYVSDTNKLYAMVEQVLVPAVHIDRMSGLILGKYRKLATPAQKAEFSKEFTTFIMRTYATALLQYTGNEKVVYQPVRNISNDKVEVKAELVAGDGATYPISLFMSNRSDTQWRAYNVVVAGIDFVGTYRTAFGEIIAQKGMDGFLADLKQKNAAL